MVFRRKILPEVVGAGTGAGALIDTFAAVWKLPQGIPVVAALGDNQASILSTSEYPDEEIYLTLGTGAQLTVVVDKVQLRGMPTITSMEIRPYLDGKYLAVAAPLCGGQAFAWLADTVQSWLRELGLPELPEYELFRKLDALGAASETSSLKVKPNFLGERHDPGMTGSIDHIRLDNFSLGGLAAALARGIVANMKTMIAPELLQNRQRVIGSGKRDQAARSNPEDDQAGICSAAYGEGRERGGSVRRRHPRQLHCSMNLNIKARD